MARERDIKHENGDFWVLDNKDYYVVMENVRICSESESAYAHTPDGLSIAICRCDYLARRRADAPPK